MCRAYVELGNLVDAPKALEELNDIAARARTDPCSPLPALPQVSWKPDPAMRQRLGVTSRMRSIYFRREARPSRWRVRVLARVLGDLGRVQSAAEEATRAVTELPPLNADLELSRARLVLTVVTAGTRQRPADRPDQRGGLTIRELQVLRLISSGLSSHAIAGLL